MDIQGYIAPKEDHSSHHYASVPSNRLSLASASDYKTTSSIPSILPTLVEEEYNSNDNTFSAATTTTPSATSINHLLSTPMSGEPSSSSIDYTAAAAAASAAVTDAVNSSLQQQQQQQQQQQEREFINGNSLNPALLLPTRFDKRKSSPAILGLPYGINHEAQLSLHLSQQRNSIEAAMLLANFTKSVAFPKPNDIDHKGHSWQDDMSIPTQNKTSWGDIMTNESEANRRHSYDVNMSWQTMPAAFLERADLFPNMSENISASSSTTQSDHLVPLFNQENHLFVNTSSVANPTLNAPTKVSWSHEDLRPSTSTTTTTTTSLHELPQPQQPTFDFNSGTSHPMSPRQQQQHDRLFHPSLDSKSLLPPPSTSSYSQHRYIPPPPSLQQQPHPQDPHQGVPMLHPLARQPDNGIKNEFDPLQTPSSYYSYTFPPQPPPPSSSPSSSYHYANSSHLSSTHGKLPLPASSSSSTLDSLHSHPLSQSLHHPHHLSPHHQQQQQQQQQSHHHQQRHHHLSHQYHQPQQQQPQHHHPPPPLLAKQPKRKKQKSSFNNVMDDFDMGEDNNHDYTGGQGGNSQEIAANEEEYPDMTSRDIEAARKDPEARPRKQKLRFAGDQYTPQWVRFNGQLKEGLCDTCKPGKWLQLKNSAYWYHKQFFHGISSVSGKEFVQPLETRWVDQDLVEGLCHQCHTWVAVSNVKRKNSVLWYRHAHKCHVYHKPKPNLPKKR
ncbi:hypothetical protein BDF20DRAFT_1003946 [Mycotypha africana]|uniref:uncharacterized protein n=1 Tax=Mycotypha africana TaxID=64632 RepID=UPI002301CF3F|nr:uncharacterized protein BDF20DRAFT_1003946 [Mycotypha africana]KAI8969220.1 hypothetical protein BDF20DRAFT_1003946 [Mycotypha africana]